MSQFLSTLYNACLAKKATDIVLLDLAPIQSYADHIIICTGSSATQVKTIADHVIELAHKQSGRTPLGSEGYEMGLWVLVDFGEVVVHVFQPEPRAIYHLEDMWPKVRPIAHKALEDFMAALNPATKTRKRVVRPPKTKNSATKSGVAKTKTKTQNTSKAENSKQPSGAKKRVVAKQVTKANP